MSVLSNTGIRAGASAAGGDSTYVEDVFSTDLYSNPGAAPDPRTVTNGINFLDEGGLLWVKLRSSTRSSVLYSTANSATSSTSSHCLVANNEEGLKDMGAVGTVTWNDNGWSVPGGDGDINGSYFGDYVSWSFRKCPGFFDIVTYTGDGVDGRNIAHNLGSVPGCIMVKKTDGADQYWAVYHVGTGATHYTKLNDSAATSDNEYFWDDTTPTATHFRVGDTTSVNANGSSYVAYLFASGSDADSQVFGNGGDESIIKCGEYYGDDSSSGSLKTLGWEPQWMLIKNVQDSAPWILMDNFRGMPVDPGAQYFQINDTDAEGTTGGADSWGAIKVLWNGFKPTGTSGTWMNEIGHKYIYIAIRRGPMKAFEGAASEVFDDVLYTGNASTQDITITPKVADMIIGKRTEANDNWWLVSRIHGKTKHLTPNSTGALATRNSADNIEFDRNNAFGLVGNSSGEVNANSEELISYSFRRWPGVFDHIYYEGTGASQDITHTLGVVPAMMIIKKTNGTEAWQVWHKDLGYTNTLEMNTPNGAGNLTERYSSNPTKTSFNVVSHNSVNGNTNQYSAFLFANCPGVSSIGKYDGNSGENVIDCGFTGGARFVMIKQTTNSNNWRVFDVSRGINTSGNDPHLSMNANDSENTGTDWVEADNSGFKLNTTNDNVNYNGETYIYMAFA